MSGTIPGPPPGSWGAPAAAGPHHYVSGSHYYNPSNYDITHQNRGHLNVRGIYKPPFNLPKSVSGPMEMPGQDFVNKMDEMVEQTNFENDFYDEVKGTTSSFKDKFSGKSLAISEYNDDNIGVTDKRTLPVNESEFFPDIRNETAILDIDFLKTRPTNMHIEDRNFINEKQLFTYSNY